MHNTPKEAYSVNEICKVLSCSRQTLYKVLIRTGELRTFTIGKRRYASHEAITDLIHKRESRNQTPEAA